MAHLVVSLVAPLSIQTLPSATLSLSRQVTSRKPSRLCTPNVPTSTSTQNAPAVVMGITQQANANALMVLRAVVAAALAAPTGAVVMVAVLTTTTLTLDNTIPSTTRTTKCGIKSVPSLAVAIVVTLVTTATRVSAPSATILPVTVARTLLEMSSLLSRKV